MEPRPQKLHPLSIIHRRPLLVTAFLLVVIQFSLIAMDPAPLFFFDSGNYIVGALGPLGENFRSYIYSYLIRMCCVPEAGLTPLVAVQSAFAGVSAWLLAFMLIRFFQVRAWVAVLAAIAFAMDPLQIVHEHMVMAEAATMLVMSVYLVIALEYLRKPGWHWLVALASCGVLLVSLRIVNLPLVLACAVLLPLAAFPGIPRPRLRGTARALAISCIVTLFCHTAYQHLTGYLTGREPAYVYTDGYFLSAAVAPILQATDADDPRAAEAIEAQAGGSLPLANPSNRSAQLWDPEGFVTALKSRFNGDGQSANRAAKTMAMHAIARDPAGFLRLGVLTWSNYWRSPVQLDGSLAVEHGVAALPQVSPYDQAMIRSHFGLDLSDHHKAQTPGRRYHRFARLWCYFLLLSPLVGILAAWFGPQDRRLGVALLAGWSILLLVITCLGAVDSAYRYLHPLSFTGLAAAALLWEERLCRRDRRGPQAG